MENDDITCPFCLEEEFDLIGLKMHLERGWCEAYNLIDTSKEQ